MKKIFLHALLGLAAAGAAASAADPSLPAGLLPPDAATKKPWKWVFSMKPKAFQRRPLLDFNVITEMSPEGKLRRQPSGEQPIYYVHQAGPEAKPGAQMNQKSPPVADLEKAMQGALTFNHYLPATPEHPATLLIVFTYGSFHALVPPPPPPPEPPPPGVDPPPEPPLPVTAEETLPYIIHDKQLRMDMIERAGLIGGSRFANELTKALIKEMENVTIPEAPVSPNPASPFQMFLSAHNELRGMVEDAFTGCYFVVASAYDYAAASKRQKLLLWRTKMTVNTFGVSMEETLQPLIASAAPFFGRPMAGPEAVARRIDREGKVEIGVPRVVPSYGDAPEDKPAEKP